jgi:hypothetical protein
MTAPTERSLAGVAALTKQLEASGLSGCHFTTQGVNPVLGVYTHYVTVGVPTNRGDPVIFMDRGEQDGNPRYCAHNKQPCTIEL